MANRNFANSRIYTGHVMPVLIDCNFVVDSTNGNGLGIRNLKGPYVQAVYMNTSATPAPGNPNPAAGLILVRLQDNYSRLYTGGSSIVSPLGSSSSTIVAGNAYVITALGTTTQAQWISAGVQKGQTPAIGLAFIAATSETIPGSPSVAQAASAGSGVFTIESIGDANQAIAPLPQANHVFGSQFILECRNASGAAVAPANGSVISLSFLLSNSSIQIAGE